MDRAETRELWADIKERPAAVIEHADALAEHTNTAEPVPQDSIYNAREWLDRFKGTVTRQLNADDAEDSGESGKSDDTEGGA